MRGAGGKALRTMALAAIALVSGCALASREAETLAAPAGARLDAEVFLSANGPDRPDARFDLPWMGARETVVALRSTAPGAMPAAVSCDGSARLRFEGPGDPGLFLRPGTTRRFTLPSRFSAEKTELILPAETERCRVTWGEGNSLPLLRENIADPAVARLDARVETCAAAPAGSDALAQAFFAARDLSQSCPGPTGAVAFYPDEIEALRLRLEKLTGAPVSRAALLAGDPDMPLDFRNAPRFEQIVLSYLHIRADLAGYLSARALAFHAARGTKIRIALTDRLVLPLDRKLFEGLAAQYPNVQIQKVGWGPRVPGPLGILIGTFRSHHVKIFAGLSPEAGASFALVGGRNLHDGFFFPALETGPKRPFLHDYDRPTLNPLAYVAYYEDFEIALLDRSAVAAMLSHFGKFWNRDTPRQAMPPAVAPAGGAPAARAEGLHRHYISLPWADAVDQEKHLVDLIDAARHEIVAIAPFIYPTEPIDAALLRAAARGVEVTLVARIGKGEPVAPVVNPSNTKYAAERGDRFTILNYVPEGGERLMHTKIVVIDERLGVVTSSNLNRRSFLHDTENGLIFLDRAVAGQLKAVVMRAAEAGEPMPVDRWRLLVGQVIDALPIVRSLY